MEQLKSDNQPDMLTVSDVHDKLQVSESTVRQLIRSRRLLSVKIGHRLLIPRHSLEAYEKELEGNGGEPLDGK
jgi:excisionase family DNA binding protein